MAGAPRVFLSYARKDGEAFATALRRRLADQEPEITLWQDRAELEGGVGWWTQIEAALDQVKFLVVVITPEAMTSEMTRREWRYARQKGVIVYPVKGVKDDQLDYGALPTWMRKAHLFDLGRWTGAEWLDAKEWETFVNYLKSDRQPVRVPFMAPDPPVDFVPRPREFAELLAPLLGAVREQSVAITTALQGAGGYGKTTLAAALCHDDRVIEAFDDGILWTSLGQTPSILEELTKLYAALTNSRPTFVDPLEAATALAQKLEHRHCLLVIDDVWERRHLEPFLMAGKHSARLVTTRRVDCVHDALRIHVDEMTADQSVAVLANAFVPQAVSSFELAAMAKRLGEWPLLLTLAAGMIRGRLARGEAAGAVLTYVERALQKRGVTAFDQRNAVDRHEAVRRTVEASLDLISREDRGRFLDLAIFPEETAIPLTTLQRLWGLDDLDADEGARRLDDVALVSLDLRRAVVTVHDVMRAYLRDRREDLPQVHARLVTGYGNLEDLPDAYAWRGIAYHLIEAGQRDALRALLLTPTWLAAKLRAVGPYAVLRDFAWIRDDLDLELLQGALRLSLPAVAADGSQLSEQLWGRLPSGGSEHLDGFRTRLARMAPVRRLRARWPNLQGPAGALIQTLSLFDYIYGALQLSDGRVLSWGAEPTLRVWNLATGEVRPLTGHEKGVVGALALADGRVLSWSHDWTLRVWNLATGEGRPLKGHRASLVGALRLADGRVLSWSHDWTLRVWDLDTGEGRPLTGHGGPILGVLELAEGGVLSWSEDGTLRVWDLATGEGRLLTGHRASVHGALRLADGRVLSWSADGTLRLWDLATGEGRPFTTEHEDAVHGAVVLRDGRLLSWGADGTLRVWDLAAGEGRPFAGHEDPVDGALMLADGRMLSWNRFDSRVWDLATGESRALPRHAFMKGALVLVDGRVLSWSGDGSLRVWDLRTSEGRALIGHEDEVRGALQLADGRVLSWSDDRTLRVWDLATGEPRPLTGHDRSVLGALMLPDGGVMSLSLDGTLRVWNLATGEGRPLLDHERFVNGALLLDDGRVLWWTVDGTLRVSDLETGEGRTLAGHARAVLGALALADGRVLSWSADRTLRVWDLATGQGRPLTGHEDEVGGALLLGDGRVLSWSADRTLRVWDLATGEGRALAGLDGGVRGALALADGRVLSWSVEGTLWVWDLATGEGRALTGHERLVTGALQLADGRVLSWSGDGTLRVWDLAAAAHARLLTGHEDFVHGAREFSDGRVLSWSADRTLRVWDVATGEGRVLTGHAGPVEGALVLPGGRVLSWSEDRTLRLHDLQGNEPTLAFFFDATPIVVLPHDSNRFFVGDALGRIHFLELVGTSRPDRG